MAIEQYGIEQSVDNVLEMPQRKLVVAKNDIDLSNNNQNDIFILMVQESAGSAGGRGGGSGESQDRQGYGFLMLRRNLRQIF